MMTSIRRHPRNNFGGLWRGGSWRKGYGPAIPPGGLGMRTPGPTPQNPMGGGRTGGGGFGQSPPSTSYMGGGGNFGPAPEGKVRGQGGQLYDYRGPTDAQGFPDLSNLPGGGAIRHGGMRGGFGGGRAQSNAFSNYSRSLRNRRTF